MIKSHFQSLLQIMMVVLFLVTISTEIYADHIIGGQMTYECRDTDLTDDVVHFEINCILFKDAWATTSSETLDFGIYEELAPNNWSWVSTKYDQNFQDRIYLPVDIDDPCFPDNVGVESTSYFFDIDLPVSDNNYMVVYQQCCRSNAINNIIDPGDTGMAIAVEISPEAQKTCDNSPQFDELPPVFVCQGQPLEVDFSAIDLEGDELRYSFCAPKTTGGNIGDGPNAFLCAGVIPDPENCLPPFNDVTFLDQIGTIGGLTSEMPIPGNPVVTINPNTGIVTGTPTQIGRYVTGVCVQAFRNNQLIAQVVRDFTLVVGDLSLSTKEGIKRFANLYPNPTTGILTIELPSLVSGGLVVRNVTGEILIGKVIENTDELQIDLTKQQAGVYFVEIVPSESTVKYIDRVVVF